MPEPITLFTFGYFGWGNATDRLVEAVDAVERRRGFAPPLFVDIRICRTVRARGFQGAAFENLLGPGRHRWMKALGNNFIESRSGPAIQIADPDAVNELLDLALESARNGRRLVFFCGCQWPRIDGKVTCHRATVTDLALKAANNRGESVNIVEWPGGELKKIDLSVPTLVFSKVQKGRTTVPLDNEPVVADIGGLPWGSIAALHSGDKELCKVVGPARWQAGQWSLPVLGDDVNEAATLRRDLGLDPRSA